MRFKNSNEQAYQAIKEMIAQYQLIPGQKMTYIQLVEKLKMSKTPIINALNRLEQEEFVISLPNRGFFIKEIDIEEVKELFEIREALQVLVIERSIKNYDDAKMKKIEKSMMDHRAYSLGVFTRKRQALDAAFHLAIANMAGNRNLVKLLKHVFERIYFRHRSEGIPPERLNTAAREHEEIFKAIKEKNLSKARACVRKHERTGSVFTIRGILNTTEKFSF